MEMVRENEKMLRSKAKKHIEINIELKKIVKKKHSEYSMHLATHSKEYYKEIEKESGEKFYGIRLYSGPKPRVDNRVKDPDILVSNGDNAECIIEVKWGAIYGCVHSDLNDFESDLNKMEKFNPESHWTCRVDGTDNFEVNDKTRFILVSDFDKAINVVGKKNIEAILSRLQSKFQKLNITFEFADIYKRVDNIPSLQEMI